MAVVYSLAVAVNAGASRDGYGLGDPVQLKVQFKPEIGGLMAGDAHPWMNLENGVARVTAGRTEAVRCAVDLADVVIRFEVQGYVVSDDLMAVNAVTRPVLSGQADLRPERAIGIGGHVVAVGTLVFVDVDDGVGFVVEMAGVGAVEHGFVNLAGMIVFVLMKVEIVCAMAFSAVAVCCWWGEGWPDQRIFAERGAAADCLQIWRATGCVAGITVKLMNAFNNFRLGVAINAGGQFGDEFVVVRVVRFESLGDGVAGCAIGAIVV